MKTSVTMTLFALCVCPATVYATSGPAPQGAQGRPAPTAGRSRLMADHSREAARTQSGLTGAGGLSGARFNQLSHGHSYITRAEARREDPLLYRHFERCDTLRDGRITRTEFKNCRGGRKP